MTRKRDLQALRLLFAALLPALSRASASAQALGPEFLVNSYTTERQRTPSVASDSSGNLFVVWHSLYGEGAGAEYGVFGQRYASSGGRLGAEFRVNTNTTDYQASASVASDALGNFVVVWHSFNQDGSSRGVYGQRYAAAGMPLGPEFRVNSYTTNTQFIPVVASDSNGNFVAVWESSLQDGFGYGVFGQRYASAGTPLGGEFRVNAYTTGTQRFASLSSDPAGGFVCVWQDSSQDGSGYGVFGRVYASAGTPLGAEFRVNTYTSGAEGFPAVARGADGTFVVVWQGDAQDGSLYSGVFGQRFDSAGAPLGTEFQVNTYTSSSHGHPKAAIDSAGTFVVVWQSYLQDDSLYGVFGQRFNKTGAPIGTEFRVNSYTTLTQGDPAVASDSGGRFVVVWHGNSEDGSNYGIFGQRYCESIPSVAPPAPVTLTQTFCM